MDACLLFSSQVICDISFINCGPSNVKFFLLEKNLTPYNGQKFLKILEIICTNPYSSDLQEFSFF